MPPPRHVESHRRDHRPPGGAHPLHRSACERAIGARTHRRPACPRRANRASAAARPVAPRRETDAASSTPRHATSARCPGPERQRTRGASATCGASSASNVAGDRAIGAIGAGHAAPGPHPAGARAARSMRGSTTWGVFRYCPIDGWHSVADNFGITVRLPDVARASPHGQRHHSPTSGTPIVAPFDGYASASSSVLGGLEVRVSGAPGYVYNAHLSSYGTLGDVAAGTVIGYVGATGDATAPTTTSNGTRSAVLAVDPYPFLASAATPVAARRTQRVRGRLAAVGREVLVVLLAGPVAAPLPSRPRGTPTTPGRGDAPCPVGGSSGRGMRSPAGGETPPLQTNGFCTGFRSRARPYACWDQRQHTPARHRQLNADVLFAFIERMSSAPYRSTSRMRPDREPLVVQPVERPRDVVGVPAMHDHAAGVGPAVEAPVGHAYDAQIGESDRTPRAPRSVPVMRSRVVGSIRVMRDS